MSTTRHTRTLPRWLGYSDIFAVVLGAIMILSVFPIGEYYWITYRISEPDISAYLLLYGFLIVIFGGIWAVIKRLFFARVLSTKGSKID